MKQTSTTKTAATSDDDAPKLAQAAFNAARFRVGGKNASRAQWQAAVRSRIGKQRVNIMLDAPIVEHFKALAGDRGYQTLINEALKQAIQAETLEGIVRKTIREELRRA